MESLGGGGAERVMLNLARKFAQWGHQVDLVVASAKGPYLSQVPDSVRLVDLRTTRTITAIAPLASLFAPRIAERSRFQRWGTATLLLSWPKTCR